MKNAYRFYSLALLSCGLAVVVAIFALALYLDPFWGDLDRLGWYATNLYGSDKPEKIANRELYDKDRHDRYYDVVVVGDSFSHTHGDNLGGRRVWQNQFYVRTGLSITAYNVADKDLRELVASPTFRSTPPKLVVYQVVERSLMAWLGAPQRDGEECSRIPDDSASIPPFAVAPVPDGESHFTRIGRPHGQMNETQLAFARDFISKRIQFATGMAHSLAVELALTRPMFHSKRPDRLLIYEDDLVKRRWSDADLAKVSCNLRRMQHMVEKNGRTHFVAFIVPDKLSAYADFLADPAYAKLSVLDRLDTSGVNLVRVDRPLREAIRQGQRDVYSSTNTHLTGDGFIFLADSLLDTLLERKIAVSGDHAPAERRMNASDDRPPAAGKLSCSIKPDGNVQIETGETEMPPSSQVNYYLASKSGEQFHFFVRGIDGKVSKIAWMNGALPAYRRGALKASVALDIPAAEQGEIWAGWGENDADIIAHTRYVRCGR